MIAPMTNKDRLAVLAIFVSVLGFSFVAALKPVMISYAIKQDAYNTTFNFESEKLKLRTLHFKSGSSNSKVVDMLSDVLGMSSDEIQLALEGGMKPSELLLSSGILLSDISEEYSFDIIGNGLIRFRA